MVAVDDSQIQARFVNSRLETKFVEDRVGMFLPESRRFRAALHCQKYGNNVTVWDGRASLVVDPPFVECLVRADEEALLRWWGFGKCI